MNILCIFQRFDFESSTIYLDLVQALNSAGHKVYVLAGTTKSVDTKRVYDENGIKVAYVSLPDQFKAGKIKKGMVQLLIEPMMLKACKQHFYNEKIDLITYPTPPITLSNVVKKLKKHYGATTYLMLKDIFPQNAVDLKMMSKDGIICKYFKRLEEKLYDVSDYIGCMSPANITYLKDHSKSNIWSRIELFPNTVRIKPFIERKQIDRDVTNFVFGGNLGKPQAVDFLLDGIKALSDYERAHFLIIGDGTESGRVQKFLADNNLKNAEYHKSLPRDEYEELLKKQDIGLVMLHPDFTIPNFPSRSLSYMQMGMPMLAVTDRITDIGKIISMDAKCGYYTPSDDLNGFVNTVKRICENKEKLIDLGKNGRKYLEENYDVTLSVKLLEKAGN